MDDDEMEKCTRRRVVLWLSVILGIFLAAGVIVAHAAPSFKSKDDRGGPASLHIYETPCESEKVKQHIRAQFHHLFKKSSLFYWGQTWESCWIEEDGVVHSVDEQGAPFQPIPRSLFRESDA